MKLGGGGGNPLQFLQKKRFCSKLSFPIITQTETGWVSEHTAINWYAHGQTPVFFPSQGTCIFLHVLCLRD